MEPVILVIHLFLALGIIVLVLLQRSEGGGLGLGGGGGLGGFSTARGTANALTKMTGVFAGLFFVTSLTLGVMAGGHSTSNSGILEGVTAADVQAPVQQGNSAGIEYIPPSEANKDGALLPIDIETVPEEKAAKSAKPVSEKSQVEVPVEQPKPSAPLAE